MTTSGVNFVKHYPERFFEFLRENDYPVYHKSPIFFRDFQYGLWRFLSESQTKVSYGDMERVAREVLEDFEQRGLVRKISRQNYELQMPQFITIFPSSGAAAPPAKPAAAPAVAKAATPATPAGTPATEVSPALAGADKAARIADVQRRMAEAKARREAGITQGYWTAGGANG